MEQTGNSHGHTPLIIGVTGAAGSGKSTVTHLLATLGAQTADADAIVRWTYNDPAFRRAIGERFGSEALDATGAVDRARLAEIAFADETALDDLECLVHPAVLDQLTDLIEEYREDSNRAPMLALEIPLLYEVGADRLVDVVLVVTAPPDTLEARLKARGWTDERIVAVREAQMPLEEKVERADYVVDASGDVSRTAAQVGALWDRLVGPQGGDFLS